MVECCLSLVSLPRGEAGARPEPPLLGRRSGRGPDSCARSWQRPLRRRGRLLLQTITVGKPSRSFELLRFAYFLHKELFQRAELPRPEQVIGPAREAGLELLHLESLRPHYVRTLEAWIANFKHHEAEAVRLTSEDLYRKLLVYLEGAARYYRTGETNIYQFLFGLA